MGIMRQLCWIATVSSLFVVNIGLARAQSAEAEGLFVEGDKLMAAGKLAQACDSFDASNRIEQRAGTLIRLGECREKNHQIASAWSAYTDALTRVKDPHKHDVALAKAKELEPKLSYLTISVPDEARIDGLTISRNGKPLDRVLWNRAVPVDGGDYVIAGRAPAHEEWSTKVTVPETGGKMTVDVPRFKDLAKLVKPSPTTGEQSDEDDRTTRPTRRGVFTSKRKIALGVAGASVVAVIAGVALGVSSKGKQDDAHMLCADPAMPCAQAAQANALISSAKSSAVGADVAFSLAAAAAIGAGVLWLTGAPDETATPGQVSVVPSLAAGETGVAIVGRF